MRRASASPMRERPSTTTPTIASPRTGIIRNRAAAAPWTMSGSMVGPTGRVAAKFHRGTRGAAPCSALDTDAWPRRPGYPRLFAFPAPPTVLFTAQQPKTEGIRSVHPVLSYDSDGDIEDTHEADPFGGLAGRDRASPCRRGAVAERVAVDAGRRPRRVPLGVDHQDPDRHRHHAAARPRPALARRPDHALPPRAAPGARHVRLDG